MAPEWIYLLKANVGITLFYAFYKLFCQRDTFFRWRRYALLSFLGISFLYPILYVNQWIEERDAQKAEQGIAAPLEECVALAKQLIEGIEQGYAYIHFQQINPFGCHI